MTVTDEYLANNRAYPETFTGPLPLPPSKNVAVVACMDARLDVHPILGSQVGESHVIRNAGGAITDDEIRSPAISQRLLGTREIILIHHSDCGMLTFAPTTGSRPRSPPRSGSSRRGRRRRSAISTTTSVSPSPGSRRARSSRRRGRCGVSSSTSPPVC